MDGIVIVAALASAFLHAAWNAAVKASPDPQGAMTAQVVASGLATVPLLFFLPLPTLNVLPFLAASLACNILSMLALLRGYAHGGFGLVYPLTRATSPLLVTAMAAFVVGERLSPAGYLGVSIVAAGVALFAVGQSARPLALAYALAAGLFAAAYAVSDAQGSRLSPSLFGYAFTLALLNAGVMGVVFQARGGSVLRALRSNAGLATVGSCAAMLSYLLILWVWTRAPIAVGAALRDTSIVFGAVIAAVVLKEGMSPARMLAVACVAVGAMILRFA